MSGKMKGKPYKDVKSDEDPAPPARDPPVLPPAPTAPAPAPAPALVAPPRKLDFRQSPVFSEFLDDAVSQYKKTALALEHAKSVADKFRKELADHHNIPRSLQFVFKISLPVGYEVTPEDIQTAQKAHDDAAKSLALKILHSREKHVNDLSKEISSISTFFDNVFSKWSEKHGEFVKKLVEVYDTDDLLIEFKGRIATLQFNRKVEMDKANIIREAKLAETNVIQQAIQEKPIAELVSDAVAAHFAKAKAQAKTPAKTNVKDKAPAKKTFKPKPNSNANNSTKQPKANKQNKATPKGPSKQRKDRKDANGPKVLAGGDAGEKR